MAKFVIDAYAWVEYFNGTTLGEKVKKIIENPSHTIYTNIITIAELSSYFGKRGYSFEEPKKILLSLSTIYTPTVEFAEEVGALHATIKKERKHIGLADIFVLSTAKKLEAKVVTGDEDFRGLKEALMIK
ncbi:PIN domain-containing protein [Candidatus Woesearchaeota archaeon]|nr:PIN domain-containing protein [Candidatus Woesearchaeota archaeon]